MSVDDGYDPKEEIAQMNFEAPKEVEDPEPIEDPQPEDPPTEEGIADPDPVEDPPVEDPTTEDPPEEPIEEVAEEEEEEEDPLKTKPEEEEDPIQKAREDLEALLAVKVQVEPEPPKEEPKEPVEPVALVPALDPAATVPVDDVDFIGDTEVDDILGSKDNLNELLNRVHKSGIAMGRQLGTEDALRNIPSIVKKNIEVEASITKAREEFFSKNEDLTPYRAVVADSFQTIASKNPELSMSDLLEKTEVLARDRLKLHRKVMVESTRNVDRKPKFEKPTKGKKPGAGSGKLTGLAKELDDMNRLGRD